MPSKGSGGGAAGGTGRGGGGAAAKPAARSFTSQDEAEAWGQSNYAAWAGSLNETEAAAVKSYQGMGYVAQNRYLRGQAGGTKGATAAKRTMSALAKSSVPEDVTVFRGYGDRFKLEDMQIGTEIHDAGFHSTTLNADNAFSGSFRARIRVPKGSRAAYINASTGVKGYEYELLLQAGSRFRVTGIDRSGYKPIVDMELIGQNPELPTKKKK